MSGFFQRQDSGPLGALPRQPFSTLARGLAWITIGVLSYFVHGQETKIHWYRAGSGGGTSIQQGMRLHGSSGQAEAGFQQEGSYRIEGGFWPGWRQLRTGSGAPSQLTLIPDSGFAGSVFRVQGRVAPGATAVRLLWGSSQQASGLQEGAVDAQGAFDLIASVPTDAQPGTWQVTALGLGLANASPVTAPFQVVITPAGGLTGRILAPSGPDLVAVPDAVLRVMDPNGRPMGTATSDVNGNYTVADLPPGFYTILVAKDGQYFDEGPVVIAPGQSNAVDVQAVPPNLIPAPAVISHIGGIVLPHPQSAYDGSQPILFTDAVSAKNSGQLALLPALPSSAGSLPIRFWAEAQFPTNPPKSERRVRFEIFGPQGQALYDFYKTTTQPVLGGHPVFGFEAYTSSLGLLLDLNAHAFPPGELVLRVTPYIGSQAGSGRIYWIEVIDLGSRWTRPWVKIQPDPGTGLPLRVNSSAGGLVYILNADLPNPDLDFPADIPLGITTLKNSVIARVPFQEVFEAAVGRGLRQSFAIPPKLDLQVKLLGSKVYSMNLPYQTRTLPGGGLKYDLGFNKSGVYQPVNLGNLTVGPFTIYQNGPGIHCFSLCFIDCDICGGYKIWVDLTAQVQANISSTIHPDLALEMDLVPSASGILGGHLKAKAGVNLPGIGDIGCSANVDVTGTVSLYLPFYYLAADPPIAGFKTPCVSLLGEAGGKLSCVGLNVGAGGKIGPFFWPADCLPPQSLGKSSDEEAAAAGLPPSPTVAANTNGHALAIWIQNEPQPAGDTLPYLTFTEFDGAIWSAAARLASSPVFAGGPSVVWRGPQDAIALWPQNRRTPTELVQDGKVQFAWQEIYWSRWNGSSWSVPVALTNDENLDAYPIVTHDRVNDETLAVWIRRLDPPANEPARNAFAAVYSRFDGARWTTPLPLDMPFPSLDTVADVRSGPNGAVWAVLQRDRDGDLTTSADRVLAISSWDGIQWSVPAIIPGLPAGVLGPSVAVDAVSRPFITYTIPPVVEGGAVGTGVGNRSRLGFAYLRTGGWEIGAVQDPVYAEAPVARVQPDGRLVILFRRFGEAGERLTGDMAVASADPTALTLDWTVDDLTEDGQSNWQIAFDLDPVTGRHFIMNVKQPPIGRSFVDPDGMMQANPRGMPTVYQAGGQPAVTAQRFDYEPDLALLPEGIRFSDPHPARGQIVQIDVEARNLGLRAMPGPVRVRFYLGPSIAGQLLGEREIVGGLQPGQRVLVSFPHTVTDPGIMDLSMQIESVNPLIESNARNNTAYVQLGTLSPPTAVVGQADNRTGELLVRWDPPDPKGGLVYDIFRADQAAGPFEWAGTTAGVEFTDPLARPGRTYFYRVIARDDFGVRSPTSDIVQATLDVEVQIRKADQGLIIAWPHRFTGFQLQEAPEVLGPWTPVNAASAVVGVEQQTSLPAVQGRRFYRVAD